MSVSDVAHQDSPEVREFLHPETLASIYNYKGVMEWVSAPEFILREGEDEQHFGDEGTCVDIRSAWDKPNMTSHPLLAQHVHTCEELRYSCLCRHEALRCVAHTL